MIATSAAWGVIKATGNRIVVQNANRFLERTGLDRLLVNFFGSNTQPKSLGRYLRTALVVGGSNDTPPEYRARFGRSGKDGVFYLEYRMAHGGMGASTGWTMTRKIEIARQDRFAADMQVAFPIVGRFDHEQEGVVWFFGNLADLIKGFPRDSLNARSFFQGRITFQADDGAEQHCNFIVATDDRASMPRVTGEHMWSHVYQWEGRPLPNVDPESLFKH